jgi:hypothetical protein
VAEDRCLLVLHTLCAQDPNNCMLACLHAEACPSYSHGFASKFVADVYFASNDDREIRVVMSS